MEDGSEIGGLHGAVSEYVSERYPGVKVTPIAIGDSYLSQGTQEELREECGLSTGALKAVFAGKCEKSLKKV